jgi:hypothetical protein
MNMSYMCDLFDAIGALLMTHEDKYMGAVLGEGLGAPAP